MVHPALDTLRRAVNAHRLNQAREALALAEAAYRMLQQIPGAPPQSGSVVSFYGFLLGTVGRRPAEGLALCREAVADHFWEPRVYEHMARLELAIGERRRALEAAERGLALSPEDRDLLGLRSDLGIRKSPPIRFLDRSHPINVFFGRMRRRQPAT
jgi:tetratricopeptide (TPR) repeat protein